MEPIQPTRLAVHDRHLIIEWSDGRTRDYDPAELRKACPCAGCAAGPGESSPTAELTVTAMQPVGNYAYRIEFSDGHTTGIFPLELLQRLGCET
jgi:DUF971 family protein